MAVINSADLAGFVIAAKDVGWGYVFSAKGQLYTQELAEEWGNAKRAGRDFDYYVNKCARWFERTVVDCSGLITEAIRSKDPGYSDLSANTIYSKCVQKGEISSIPEIPGICVWRSGHIGIYIGDKKVVEAAGTNKGVVLSSLYAPATEISWTDWGKLQDVEYPDVSLLPITGPAASFWLGRELKLATPYMQGEDVTRVQAALEERGFSPGEVNGIYGLDTQDAVTRFQQYAGLVVSGVVDENTTFAMLGVWADGDEGAQLGAFSLGRTLKNAFRKMEGDDVKDLQDALAAHGFSLKESNGIYDRATKNAVKIFQKSSGLKLTGVVDKETAGALGGVWAGN